MSVQDTAGECLVGILVIPQPSANPEPCTLCQVVFGALDSVATGAWFPQPDGSARVDFPSFTPAIFINMVRTLDLVSNDIARLIWERLAWLGVLALG